MSTPLKTPAAEMLEEYLRQAHVPWFSWERQPLNHEAGRAIFSASAELQIRVVHAAVEELLRQDNNADVRARQERWLNLGVLLKRLLARRLPSTQQDLEQIFRLFVTRIQEEKERASPRSPYYSWLTREPIPQFISHLERDAAERGLSPELRQLVERLREFFVPEWSGPVEDQLIGRIDVLLGSTPMVRLDMSEPWAAAAYGEFLEMSDFVRWPWMRLLSPVRAFSSPKPTRAWLEQSKGWVQEIGEASFRERVARWCSLVNHLPAAPLCERCVRQLIPLVWSCSLIEEHPPVRALSQLAEACYRKVDTGDWRSQRVGNACIQVLASLSGSDPVAELARLQQRIRYRPAQKMIAAALDAAAERAGLSREELEEIVVPTYGLGSDGRLSATMSGFTAEIAVTGSQGTQWAWRAQDGKLLKSVPAEVKRQCAGELKALKQTVGDIEKMLPAQRERIEALLRTERSWPLPAWRERYLDHPLLANLTRRLIWHFRCNGQTALGIWHETSLVDHENRPLDWLTDETEVRLWHPIGFEPKTVLQWRMWLEEHGVTQPFKQAHREVYLLTDAELNTRTYSNRFAAHLLKQHQFKALCDQKGWQYRLELVYDGGSGRPVAALPLPQWGLSAEFWVEPAGGEETWTPAGAYLYVSTDQVRFCDPDGTPRPLMDVSALAFTEVMRDVDLFVGVASVGNDPTWVDSGGVAGYRDYWREYAFGDLSASAKTRAEVLSRLLPRLKIAARCSLDGRFLVVRGDLRTYKIHLGSGNILMEPNDHYLCIVPDRTGAAKGSSQPLFLPFEGDRTLSVILSKALMLAEDTKIKDATILSQIRRP